MHPCRPVALQVQLWGHRHLVEKVQRQADSAANLQLCSLLAQLRLKPILVCLQLLLQRLLRPCEQGVIRWQSIQRLCVRGQLHITCRWLLMSPCMLLSPW